MAAPMLDVLPAKGRPLSNKKWQEELTTRTDKKINWLLCSGMAYKDICKGPFWKNAEALSLNN